MKNAKAQLERRRPLFFVAGLLFALSVTLVSFEWRTPYQEPFIPDQPTCIGCEDPIWIPVTLSEPDQKKDKPKAPNVVKPSIDFVVVDEPDTEQTKEEEVLTLADIEDLSDVGEAPEEAEVVDDIPKIWEFAAIPAAYCGGELAMLTYLHENLEYPEIPLRNGVSGTVHVRFVVGKDGKLRDAKVVRPIDPWLDAEALRVAKKLDCFTPGKQAGRNVAVYFVLPIRFALSEY